MAADDTEMYPRAGIGAFSSYAYNVSVHPCGLLDRSIATIICMTWSNAFSSPAVGSTSVPRDLHTSAHPSHGCVLNWTEAHPGCTRTETVF
jgi:hypothetical protein